jgi:hypothetical protein
VRSAAPARSARRATGETLTEVKVFDGPHLLPANDNWEEVADDALTWALEHARATEASGR